MPPASTIRWRLEPRRPPAIDDGPTWPPFEGSHLGPTSTLALSPSALLVDSCTSHDPFHRCEQRHRVAYRPGAEPLRFPMREHGMADKSPRQSMSKKSGTSIKDKRIQRKAKADVTAQMERLTRDKKH